MQIFLLRNEGFKWAEYGGIYFKGFFYYENKLYQNNDAYSIFSEICSFEKFIHLLKQLNGCFSIVIKKPEVVWLAADIARSLPLFYSTNGNIVSDSAECIYNNISMIDRQLDIVSLSELLLSHNCISGSTVYQNIKQVELGQALEIKRSEIKKEYYFKHVHFNKDYSYTELVKEFNRVTDATFARLIKSLHGRAAIIPLSGGYDSRFIVSMLKNKKYSNVICYTYGLERDYEVKYAKLVAEKLGYKWFYVNYTKDMWREFFNDKNTFVRQYFDYAHNHSSLPHIQDFMALQYLKENKVLPANSIIVTGFCGDLPAGSFVKDKRIPDKYSLESACEYIFKTHFNNAKIINNIETIIKNKIRAFLFQMGEINDFESFTSIYESWFTSDRPSQWVVNSNRVYEYFCLEWRMPFWDVEYLKFWYSLNSDYRINSFFYEKWLFEYLFLPLGIGFKKPKATITADKRLYLNKVKYYLKQIAFFLSVVLEYDLYKRNNTNNYNEAAILLAKKINSRKLQHQSFKSVHQLMALWWCEYKYGVKVIEKILLE